MYFVHTFILTQASKVPRLLSINYLQSEKRENFIQGNYLIFESLFDFLPKRGCEDEVSKYIT